MNETTPAPEIGHNLPPPDATIAVAALDERAKELVGTANRWIAERREIADEAQERTGRDFLDQLAKHGKEIDRVWTEFDEPHKRAVAANKAAFRPIADLIERAHVAMKAMLGRWMIKQEAVRLKRAADARAAADAALRAADEAKRKADVAAASRSASADPIGAAARADEAKANAETAAATALAIGAEKTQAHGNFAGRALGLVTIWLHEVQDAAAVPDEYWIIDEKKLGQVVRATKGTLTIPGVRIWSTQEPR